MKRGILLAALVTSILCVSLVVSGLTETSVPEFTKKDFTGQPVYEVLRVIDGDTVELLMDGNMTTVRLIGVDTPEPSELYGNEALRFTTDLLKGENVYTEQEPGNTVDRYGRTLLYLYRVPDGLFVNLEIIRQGYGHAYTVYPFQYLELFKYYEKRAQELGKGLRSPAERDASIVQLEKEDEGQIPGDDVTVHITRTGRKYHRPSCRHLSRSKIQITLKEARERGYTPCKVCKPPQ